MKIDESLYFQSKGYRDRISFCTAIMTDKMFKPDEQHLHYNTNTLIKKGRFDIINGISEHFILVHLM